MTSICTFNCGDKCVKAGVFLHSSVECVLCQHQLAGLHWLMARWDKGVNAILADEWCLDARSFAFDIDMT